MNRITITRNKQDEIIVQHERLSKQPPGNAQQRQKAVRRGWRPSWIKTGQPELLYGNKTIVSDHLALLPGPGMLTPPVEIGQGIAMAMWAEGFVERDCAATRLINELQHIQFCRESGLI